MPDAENPAPPPTDSAELARHFGFGSQIEPSPPFQVRNCSGIYIAYELTEAQAATFLPPGLKPHSPRFAALCFLSAPTGLGPEPFSNFWFGLAVEGFDLIAGEPGYYAVAATGAGKFGEVFYRDFNANFRKGNVDFTTTDTEMRAAAEVDGGAGQITVSVRPGTEAGIPSSGGENYLGLGQEYDLIQFAVTSTYNYTVGTLTGLHFNLPPGHPLALLSGLTPSLTVCQTDMAMTVGVPGPARGALADKDTSTPVLDLLSHIGRPVVIVEAGGRILYLNGEAEDILGRDPTRTRRLPSDLRALVPTAPDARSGVKRTAMLTLPSGAQILATAFPIALRLSDAPAMMVLLTDPHTPGPTNPEPLLRLMGFTPSEAALAALIGAGATPAEAAAARGITQSTARSTLKLIFGKLNIRRQADLAQIVTRLQST